MWGERVRASVGPERFSLLAAVARSQRLSSRLASPPRPSVSASSVARVGPTLPSVEDAIALAAHAHRGQRYPSPEAEPYIFHPLRVMLSFSDSREQMAAVLHDTIEDTELEADDLAEAGYPAEVVDAVDCLTHRDGETYEAYIERVATNEIARRVKIVDVTENLANNRRSPGAPGNAERIARYQGALARLTVPSGGALGS